VRAEYQKGEFQGMYSGAVYARGVPLMGYNDTYKDKVGAKLLAEHLRFNTELKLYTAKVYSPEQAIMVREAAKMVCDEDEVTPRLSVPLNACLHAPPSDARCAPVCLVRLRDRRKL